jgi:hypothetical protein
MAIRLKRGMGSTADLPTSIFGGPYHCEYAVNWAVNPACWKYSTTAWDQMVQFGRPDSSVIAPPPAVPEAYGKTAAPYDCAANPQGDPSCPGYDAAVAVALAAGKAQTDANVQNFYANQPSVGPGCTGQYQDENGDWQCPSGSTNWMLYGVLAIVGVVALTSIGGGSARRYGR